MSLQHSTLPRRKRTATGRKLAAGAAGAALAVALVGWAAQHEAPVADRPSSHPAAAQRAATAMAPGPRAPSPPATAPADHGSPRLPDASTDAGVARDAIDPYRREASAAFDDMLELLAALEESRPDDTPEGYVNGVTEQAQQILAGLVGSQPLQNAATQELAARLCERDAPKVQSLLYARVLLSGPQLASEQAFECLLTVDAEEDILLWEAMDAVQVAGFPWPSGFVERAEQSTDPRTLRRLVPIEERADIAEHEQPSRVITQPTEIARLR